jgi:hypothetical protein
MSHGMVGMATEEQMTNLADSKSIDFDELFLSLMITSYRLGLTKAAINAA